MTAIHDVDMRMWTQRSNARATLHKVATGRGRAAECDSVGTLEHAGYREYRVAGAAAAGEPKSIVKALALIIGAVVVVGTGAVVGAASLATPPPAHPMVAPAGVARPGAFGSEPSVIINIPKPK
jgi:hypothetical protein